MHDALRDVCVVLPTYDEAATIEEVLARLRAALPGATLLVVDDGSPDGTADIVDAVADRLGPVHCLRRAGKQGLGSAYRAGLRWALWRGFRVAVAMDSDLSHPPEVAPQLVAELDDPRVHLAIGSRYVAGGGTEGWPLSRQLLSRGGNLYAGRMLGLSTRDATAGFRAYRLRSLQRLGIDSLRCEGYAFQLETVHRIGQRFGDDAVVEVPITFRERVAGQSKMNWRIALEGVTKVTRWGLERRRRPRDEAEVIVLPEPAPTAGPAADDEMLGKVGS